MVPTQSDGVSELCAFAKEYRRTVTEKASFGNIAATVDDVFETRPHLCFFYILWIEKQQIPACSYCNH